MKKSSLIAILVHHVTHVHASSYYDCFGLAARLTAMIVVALLALIK